MARFDDLPKAYEAASVETDIFQNWENSGAFNPDKLAELDPRYQNAEPYCIVLPPPNRTGTLHLGHASMLAIEDLLIRFHRMAGEKAYWVPGTDHAAISTQVKVEQILIEQGMKDPRREMGREKFLEKVREFAQNSRDTIVSQCKAMGASMDWRQEKYTLDEERNKAVNAVFKMMFEDGLIERGFRVVNWDPQFKTTLSDDEVEMKETTARLLTFKYDKDFPIAISTTRPETKFGDTAVAVHPADERYKEYVGKTYEPIFCGKRLFIKIIADEFVDPAFGTGALGVTPAHSMIDAEIAERHGLPTVQVIDQDARMIAEAVGQGFGGLSTVEARKRIEETLKAQGILKSVEDAAQSLPIAQRGGATVEQLSMKQWFIRVNKPFKLRQNSLGKWKKGDTATLKDLMREAVTSGQTRIVPERFEKVYFHWIDNLRDWCISRQIWFGHRIPVWYRERHFEGSRSDEEFSNQNIQLEDLSTEFILSEVEGLEMTISSNSPGEGWEQDLDTLDTWFSSGLWTFSTLGWPDNASVDADGNLVKKGELAEYHPTAVLETGYDILFFWIARMVLMSTYALGEVPFRDVYLHGLVRDEQGRKMSKSLGNVINPLDMIRKYGTDAVRLSLVLGTTPGQDQKLSEEKIQGFRNFTNKLWNISRFVLSVIPSKAEGSLRSDSSTALRSGRNDKSFTLADQWILSRLTEVTESVTRKIQAYELSSAGEELRDFTWGDLADWYLEIAKIQSKDVGAQGLAPILSHILKTILALWHPFMPFVTEYVWQTAGFPGSLIVAPWPTGAGARRAVPLRFDCLRDIVTVARRLRAENGIEPQKQIEIVIQGAQEIQDQSAIIAALCRASSVEFVDTIPAGWASLPAQKGVVGLNVAGAINVEKEKAKLEIELKDTENYVASLEAKLANKEFTSKAPAKVVEEMKAKLAGAKEKIIVLNKSSILCQKK